MRFAIESVHRSLTLTTKGKTARRDRAARRSDELHYRQKHLDTRIGFNPDMIEQYRCGSSR